MRGTCSAGFTLRAQGDAAQLLPVPYEAIHAQSMVPAAHILWSSAWAGIAASAVEKARRYLRKARQGRRRAAAQRALLHPRQRLAASAARADRHHRRPLRGDRRRSRGAEWRMDFQSEINLLKVDASELAVQAVMSALRCGGLSQLSQRQRRLDRPPPARRALLADHDQQRPHPRQRRRLGAADRGAGHAQGLKPVTVQAKIAPAADADADRGDEGEAVLRHRRRRRLRPHRPLRGRGRGADRADLGPPAGRAPRCCASRR